MVDLAGNLILCKTHVLVYRAKNFFACNASEPAMKKVLFDVGRLTCCFNIDNGTIIDVHLLGILTY